MASPALSTRARYFSSLSTRARSARFRSVMSVRMPGPADFLEEALSIGAVGVMLDHGHLAELLDGVVSEHRYDGGIRVEALPLRVRRRAEDPHVQAVRQGPIVDPLFRPIGGLVEIALTTVGRGAVAFHSCSLLSKALPRRLLGCGGSRLAYSTTPGGIWRCGSWHPRTGGEVAASGECCGESPCSAAGALVEYPVAVSCFCCCCAYRNLARAPSR
jgi:hypothetical protein